MYLERRGTVPERPSASSTFGTFATPNVVGDINTVFGKVVGKSTVGGEHLVELLVYNENQACLATAEFRITVALPTRAEAAVSA